MRDDGRGVEGRFVSRSPRSAWMSSTRRAGQGRGIYLRPDGGMRSRHGPDARVAGRVHDDECLGGGLAEVWRRGGCVTRNAAPAGPILARRGGGGCSALPLGTAADQRPHMYSSTGCMHAWLTSSSSSSHAGESRVVAANELAVGEDWKADVARWSRPWTSALGDRRRGGLQRRGAVGEETRATHRRQDAPETSGHLYVPLCPNSSCLGGHQ